MVLQMSYSKFEIIKPSVISSYNRILPKIGIVSKGGKQN